MESLKKTLKKVQSIIQRMINSGKFNIHACSNSQLSDNFFLMFNKSAVIRKERKKLSTNRKNKALSKYIQERNNPYTSTPFSNSV